MLNGQGSSRLERRLYTLYHGDGILDLVIGVILLLFGTVIFTGQFAFIGMIGIPAVFYFPLKQRFAVPRMGYIRFEPEAQGRQRLFIWMGIGLALFIVVAALMPLAGGLRASMDALPEQDFKLLFGAGVGMALLAAGLVMKCNRFYAYALIQALLALGARFIGYPTAFSLLLTGLTAAVAGFVTLRRFLALYPQGVDEHA